MPAAKEKTVLDELAVELGLGPDRTIGQLRAVCRRVRHGLDVLEQALAETDEPPKTKKERQIAPAPQV